MKRLVIAAIALIGCLRPVLAGAQTDQVLYYHTDAIGSVRMITDANGQVVERHDYLPFGQEYLPPQPSTERRLYTSKEHDSETGLDYFGARYYTPVSGRFTTVDPGLEVDEALFDPQKWNRYSYVGNRPFRYVDPDGRQAVIIAPTGYKPEDIAANAAWRQWVAFQASAVPLVVPALDRLASIIWPVTYDERRFALTLDLVGTFAGGMAVEGPAFSRRMFRASLNELEQLPEVASHAHHVFPVKFGQQFEVLGIDVNNPRYGSWWEAVDHLTNAKGYNEAWEQFFSRTRKPTVEQVLKFGRDLAEQYGFEVHY